MPVPNPIEVGLTGGIGSGKSVVARIFGLWNVPVYESDTEAKKLYYQPEIKEKVISLFGLNAYKSTTEIDSQWIATRIYSEPKLRELLNQIIHPAVGNHYREWLGLQDHIYVLKVAALVFEADIYKSLDMTLLVVSPMYIRRIRIAERDTFRTEEQIDKIIASQMREEDKIALANGIIYNDEQNSLLDQVQSWDQTIKSGSFKLNTTISF